MFFLLNTNVTKENSEYVFMSNQALIRIIRII